MNIKKARQWLEEHWLGLPLAYIIIIALTYIALWQLAEPLGIPGSIDGLEQLAGLTKYRFFFHIVLTFLIGAHVTLILEGLFRRKLWTSYQVKYQAHIEGDGWISWAYDGEVTGDPGKGKRMEAIRVELSNDLPPEMSVTYQAHVQNKGWMDWVSNGEDAGTTRLSLRMESIRIKLDNAPPGYSIVYRACVEGNGECRWMNWVSDGEDAGTTGIGKRLEAIRILVIGPRGFKRREPPNPRWS
jgi:hypothetical protein